MKNYWKKETRKDGDLSCERPRGLGLGISPWGKIGTTEKPKFRKKLGRKWRF